METIKAKRSVKVNLFNVCKEVAMIKQVMFQSETDNDIFYKEFEDYKAKVKQLEDTIKNLEERIKKIKR